MCGIGIIASTSSRISACAFVGTIKPGRLYASLRSATREFAGRAKRGATTESSRPKGICSPPKSLESSLTCVVSRVTSFAVDELPAYPDLKTRHLLPLDIENPDLRSSQPLLRFVRLLKYCHLRLAMTVQLASGDDGLTQESPIDSLRSLTVSHRQQVRTLTVRRDPCSSTHWCSRESVGLLELCSLLFDLLCQLRIGSTQSSYELCLAESVHSVA